MKKFDEFIKTKSEIESETIEREQIQKFEKVMGLESSNEGSLSKTLNHIPTFLTRFRAGEFKFFDRMGIQLKDVLHGEQEYEYLKEVNCGETIFYQTTLISAPQKQIKETLMTFFLFETLVSGNREMTDLRSKCRSTIIFREKVQNE